MSFPNTMYKPGDSVWFVDAQEQAKPAKVTEVVWTKDGIGYRLWWNGKTGHEVRDPWDGDDLYPTEEAALRAANETGSQ